MGSYAAVSKLQMLQRNSNTRDQLLTSRRSRSNILYVDHMLWPACEGPDVEDNHKSLGQCRSQNSTRFSFSLSCMKSALGDEGKASIGSLQLCQIEEIVQKSTYQSSEMCRNELPRP
ncbi:hypothetical protein HPP92_014596 [Vanilla planifolia]|uniref:Uncharacterized protein n=1 Tax=Vanilla planifolia TaxID=51239 RepID=A0A835QN01_VANPL|nr:hypothetical protein HPP92_014596 [Vanilla planifolia]